MVKKISLNEENSIKKSKKTPVKKIKKIHLSNNKKEESIKETQLLNDNQEESVKKTKKIHLVNDNKGESVKKIRKTKQLHLINDNEESFKKIKQTKKKHLSNIRKNDLHLLSHHIKKNAKINFNKILEECVKNKDFAQLNNLSDNNLKQLEQDYDNSFSDIKKFRNDFTITDTTNIDTIIYHDENNDGMIACAIVRHYLKENGKNNIKIIATKPGKNIPDDLISNRNIIVVDLSFTKEMLQTFKKYTNSLIIIDDHPETLKDSSIFNGTKHSACAYTWKFFYPRLEVPKVIQYVDDSDAKLFLKYIPKTYSHLFNHGLGFRYGHNKTPKMILKKKSGEIFEELWFILMETIPNFWITAGYYYSEVTENLKEQIAINAVVRDFDGFKVGILNFNAPALVKPVCRQIITNFKNKGVHIDFVLLFGYEFTSNSWRCQLLDDHRQTTINMGEISRKFGRLGGHPKGGNGHDHVGNFYWPRTKNQDIWDLFHI